MAVTEPYTGTEAVVGTEWSLTSDSSSLGAITTAGMYQCLLDLNALAVGDVFEFRVYDKCRSGDTQRLVYSARFADVQSPANWASPALMLINGWEMSLKRITGGSARTILWSIRKAA